MSIRWQCECGKSLKAPDGSSGRKARCPQCGSINVVPAAAVEDADALGLLQEVPPPPHEAFPPPPPPPIPVRSGDPFGDENDFGEYDIKEPEPLPQPVRRSSPAGAVPSAANIDVPITPPPYRSAARHPIGEEHEELALDESRRRTWRDFTYLALLLALIPLAISSFRSDDGTIVDMITRSVQAHPEVADKLAEMEGRDDVSDDDVINAFPGHRLDGAFLPRDTVMHWGFAVISAALFFAIMFFLFDGIHDARPLGLILCGLFTGTVGIIILLVFQFIAQIALGMRLRSFGSGKAFIIILLIKLIGFSYYAAEDPDNGFILSFFGYTVGVGLCEEICKILPILWLLRTQPDKATWRGLCKWGLASGVGFGVAEGIMYSGRYYNGIFNGEIYLVRFASCVALHAVWSASFAIALYLNSDKMAAAPSVSATLGWALVFAGPPMILHGLYDTLLKKEHNLMALAIALFSFVYLAALIEWSLRKPDPGQSAPPQRGLQAQGRRFAMR